MHATMEWPDLAGEGAISWSKPLRPDCLCSPSCLLQHHRDRLVFAMFDRDAGEGDAEPVQHPEDPPIDLFGLVAFVDAAIGAVSLRAVDEEVQ